MAPLYKFGDTISMSQAQVDVATILAVVVGQVYTVTLSVPSVSGYGTRSSSYTARVGDTPSSIAAALVTALLRDQPFLSFAQAGTTVVLVSPLGVSFTTSVVANMGVVTRQAAVLGRIPENLRVLEAREIWTKDTRTGVPVEHTWVRARVLERADVVELLSDEILTLVEAA